MIIPNMAIFRSAIKDKKVVIFCAGEYCMRFLNRLEESELKQICFIADNDPDKNGTFLYNIPVKAPAAITSLSPSDVIVVIASENSIPEIYDQIKMFGDYFITSARILINDVFSQVAQKLYETQCDIKTVSDMLIDNKSKMIYNEVIKRRMLYGECDFRDLIVRGDAEYRVPLLYGYSHPKDEIIIDCGAYTGDTLKKFAETFGPKLKKIYCFECMEESIEALNITITQIKNKKYYPQMIMMPYALSDHDCKMKFAKTSKPNGSFLINNREFAQSALYESEYVEVDVTSLDNVIPQDEKITLIKMDIEGSEWTALHGAEKLIKRCKPRLAISIYHCGEDYTRIPLYLKEIVSEYKFAVRHHNKNHCDTDLYCWVEE